MQDVEAAAKAANAHAFISELPDGYNTQVKRGRGKGASMNEARALKSNGYVELYTSERVPASLRECEAAASAHAFILVFPEGYRL